MVLYIPNVHCTAMYILYYFDLMHRYSGYMHTKKGIQARLYLSFEFYSNSRSETVYMSIWYNLFSEFFALRLVTFHINSSSTRKKDVINPYIHNIGCGYIEYRLYNRKLMRCKTLCIMWKFIEVPGHQNKNAKYFSLRSFQSQLKAQFPNNIMRTLLRQDYCILHSLNFQYLIVLPNNSSVFGTNLISIHHFFISLSLISPFQIQASKNKQKSTNLEMSGPTLLHISKKSEHRLRFVIDVPTQRKECNKR